MIAKVAASAIALFAGACISPDVPIVTAPGNEQVQLLPALYTPATVVSGNEAPLLELGRKSLIVFNEPPIEESAPDTYRIVWNPAHMNAAVISVSMRDGNPYLRLSQTDGFGTYTLGKLKSHKETQISQAQFLEVAMSFRALASLVPQGSDTPIWPDGKQRVCLHSPSYTLESRIGAEARIVDRWCHPDFSKDFAVAEPLVMLARAKFPNEMKDIDPGFLYEPLGDDPSG